jgi:hypothetical protein
MHPGNTVAEVSLTRGLLAAVSSHQKFIFVWEEAV